MRFLILFLLLFLTAPVYAEFNPEIEKEISIQKQIDEIGFKILNSNKIKGRVVFAYNQKGKFKKIKDTVITKQVVLSDNELKFLENEDEKAAYLAREIALAKEAYSGFLGTLQVKFSPKKYELVADKEAVELMVTAGYNPIGLITFINKSCRQGRQDKISKHNLTSKRLMYIYEKIYYDYPYFLVNNKYENNDYYQNFLLNSIDNRRKFLKSVKKSERGKALYE